MSDQNVNRVYGIALFEAIERRNLDDVLAEMFLIESTLASSEELRYVLNSPAVSKDQKKTLLLTVFGENGLSERTMNFLKVLIDKGRFANFHGVYSHFKALVRESENIYDGILLSPYEIDESKINEIESRVSVLLSSRERSDDNKPKKVNLTLNIDKSLLGGIIVFIDGKVIDASMRGRLRGLKEDMLR